MTSVLYGPPKEIESLADFIKAISNKPENNGPETYKLQFLYRGHSSADYDLCPSISRYKNSIKAEPGLIQSACNRMPQTFAEDSDTIALLAKMQHYGLPTRLIDFTLNPLVALFFACQPSEPDKDPTGVILEMNNHVHCSGNRVPDCYNLLFDEVWKPDDENSENNVIRNISYRLSSNNIINNLICACIHLVPEDGIAVKDFIELVEKEKWFIRWAHACNYNQMPEKEKELAVTALLKIPMIVEAQELLERQRIQQGVYLLIPNMLCKEKGTYMIKKELPKLYFRDRRMGKYTIKEKNKKKILHDLDIVGINDGFLFGDSIDKVCAYIKSSQC